MKDLPQVTGLRAVAATWVFLFHVLLFYLLTGTWEARWTYLGFNWGWIGVDLFFVLSGFLLALPILERPEGARAPGFWRKYMSKRWFRIAPPYYVSIVFALAIGGRLAFAAQHPGIIALHLAYLHNVSWPTARSIADVYWTLADEFQFYLILPFLALLFARRHWKLTLAASLVLSMAWRYETFRIGGPMNWWTFTVPGFLFHFCAGIAAARLYRDGWRLPGRIGAWTAVFFAGFIVAPLYLLVGPTSTWQAHQALLSNVMVRPMLAVGFAGLLLCALTQGAWLSKPLASPLLQAVGNRSYSLYLVHFPILAALMRWPALTSYGFVIYLLITALVCFTATELFYRFVERPSLSLRQWVLRSRTPRAVRGPVASAASVAGVVGDVTS